jgi:hypothetical protein
VFTDNPFATLSTVVPPAMMQGYVVLMAFLVAGGTLFDILHKKSARYFFEAWRQARHDARRRLGAAEMAWLAIHSAGEGLVSGEFCSAQRRIAHLLMMYGFLAHVVTTVILVFGYPTQATPAPAILPLLWYAGAAMVCLGGAWFWLFVRPDVVAEGKPPWRLVRADLFVVSLWASATLGLAWALAQSSGLMVTANALLAAYLVAVTMLFGSVPWSKFAHMFFKPAAALQRRVEQANGSRRNLPPPANVAATLGSARRTPCNY